MEDRPTSSGQLNRAIQESFDMMRDSLNCVNSALAENMDEFQALRSRAKQRAAIELLMESNLEMETNLSEVYQSLRDMSKGLTALEMDKDIQEASDLAEEFLGKKHHKIQKFLLDIEASMTRLQELCGFKNRRIDQLEAEKLQLEAEKLQLKEENAAHQLQIRRLRDTIMSGKQGSAEESLEQVMKSPMLQSLPLTEVTPALFKYSGLRPTATNEQMSITNLPKICDGTTMSPGDLSTFTRQAQDMKSVDTSVHELMEDDMKVMQTSTCHVSTLSSDRFVEEEQARVKPVRHLSKPLRRRPVQSTMWVLKNVLSKKADWKEDLERYKREIVDEGILKSMMMGETYQVDMQSQVTNLKLLSQATAKGQISPELHCMAKDLITSIQDMEGMRLACLLQKFTAFKSIKQVSKTLTVRMRAARELKDGRSLKEMYSFMTKLDVYRKQVLEGWSAKRAEVERNRKTCLAQMLYLFNEIRKDCKLHLCPPVPRPSEPRPLLTVEPCKLARSPTAAVKRCYRLPPIAEAIPLVPARAETKRPALIKKGSGERKLFRGPI
ncbi:hypothetical protein DPEC_G00313820 [Dallia pectoralis]|uniref:Uncharacterized protein n=1 Tax=Dallia pectoralis TaxID=75939 RepID=A0ACC2FBZ1_DALPE|nr:hypothetical protein DPEC_G00313820 [Dallia pectoralis]